MFPEAEIRDTINLMRPQTTGFDLTRVGSAGDGGYLVPDDLSGIGACFSPGVSYKADFEEDLIDRLGITCFLADASVESSPIQNEYFDFEKKFLGKKTENEFITLEDWISSKTKPGSEDNDLILQMDIEGAEFDVINHTSSETLSKFRIVVAELHYMYDMFDPQKLRGIKSAVERMSENFVVAHIHPNNCCGLSIKNGIQIPKVFEVTWFRKDRIRPLPHAQNIQIPHPMDGLNVPANPELLLPNLWWL